MKVYDYYRENSKKFNKMRFGVIYTVIGLVILIIYAALSYLEVIQLDEIGNYSGIYLKNLLYKVVFFFVSFIVIFFMFSISNKIVLRKCKKYHSDKKYPMMNLPYMAIIIGIAFLGALLAKDVFYLKFLEFFNSTDFNVLDPIFSNDVSYYIFKRPFIMSLYRFFSFVWFLVIIFTILNYIIIIMPVNSLGLIKEARFKPIINHNLVNISVFFLIKVFSYKFQKESILYSSNDGVNGARYVLDTIWLKYYTIAPFLLGLIVILAFIFIKKGKVRYSVYAISVFPIVWILVSIIAIVTQKFFVDPNSYKYEKDYIKNNMVMTQKAYNIEGIEEYDFNDIEPLTYDTIQKNEDTKKSIRVVDLDATLDSNKQLQSLTPFYDFNDGDILSYEINGEKIPVLISAREVNTQKIETKGDNAYINKMFRYTHGYGVVINPINKLTNQGQTEFYMSGLENKSDDDSLKVEYPQIYYGELTNDYVVVNNEDSNKLTEIDKDGTKQTNYEGKGGIKLNFLKRLLFSIQNSDGKLLISSNINSNSRMLLNRNIIERVQKAVPFIKIDSDAYIVLTDDGRLKWILDGYTTSSSYPNAQYHQDFNYIRNSLKIVVDAYDGSVDYYIIDKEDPVIKTYNKIYDGVFKEKNIPDYVKEYIRYPEELFNIQSEMLTNYHLDPNKEENIRAFDGKQKFWNLATIQDKDTKQEEILEPFYNMIELPGDYSEDEELILMRAYTPIGEKHNLVSWFAVRNSYNDYGKLIVFNFSNDSNVYGPYQIEDKINQIDSISEDMTLWGTSGSEVFKGNLLVIPIDNSLLYVEPIYIKSSSKSIPEVRRIVVGYQDGNEFKYGIGTDLDLAIKDLFNITHENDSEGEEKTDDTMEEEKNLDDIKEKYEEIQNQLDELGDLIGELEE